MSRVTDAPIMPLRLPAVGLHLHQVGLYFEGLERYLERSVSMVSLVYNHEF